MSIPMYYLPKDKVLAIILSEESLNSVTSYTILGCITTASVDMELELDLVLLCFPLSEEGHSSIIVSNHTPPGIVHDVISILTRHRNRVGGIRVETDGQAIKNIMSSWTRLSS